MKKAAEQLKKAGGRRTIGDKAGSDLHSRLTSSVRRGSVLVEINSDGHAQAHLAVSHEGSDRRARKALRVAKLSLDAILGA
jgi:hypothetical protein